MMKITKEKIREYAKKYDERYRATDDEIVEKETKKWLRSHRFLDRARFIKVGLWKSKRPKKQYERNDDLLVKEVTRFSLRTISEEARIESLRVLHGVSYPLASVILHFSFPDRYPIMDFRAIWSLGWPQRTYDFDFWQKYCKEIKRISGKIGESIRTIDKALWEYSKENQK